MKRFGQVIKVKGELFEQYKMYHAEVWKEVLHTISSCNIRNYSIYHKDDFLFAYFEYTGENFARDMEKMSACPFTKKWWSIMKPLQEPLATRQEGEWWADMEEVFHLD
jgi:L-rhamnose mutarotase